MDKRDQLRYEPDLEYIPIPGETLLESLNAIDMTQRELSRRMGRPAKTINEIIKGKAAITAETALQLERVLGVPASLWNNLESQYREALARKEEKARLSLSLEILAEIPVSEMCKFGWIEKKKDKCSQLGEVLNFFGVVSTEQISNRFDNIAQVCFRRSRISRNKIAGMAAWIRAGELACQEIITSEYDEKRFREMLLELRDYLQSPLDEFLPKIKISCAECGVAVALIPSISSLGIYGATRWISSHKALLQLSLLYKTADHLWFTFFHEAAHILMHKKRGIFLETNNITSTEEEQADEFASGQLIPSKDYKAFLSSRRKFERIDILSFADQIAVHPGIVVGRLQHDKIIPYSHFNDMKMRLEWA